MHSLHPLQRNGHFQTMFFLILRWIPTMNHTSEVSFSDCQQRPYVKSRFGYLCDKHLKLPDVTPSPGVISRNISVAYSKTTNTDIKLWKKNTIPFSGCLQISTTPKHATLLLIIDYLSKFPSCLPALIIQVKSCVSPVQNHRVAAMEILD